MPFLNRYTRPIARYAAKRAGSYLGRQTGRYVKRKLSGSMNRPYSKRGTSGTGITKQHDVKYQYTKRRMPYKKRKRWVQHVKKVQAVMNKDQGTKTVVFNTNLTTSISASGLQNYNFHCLYGKSGQASSEIGSQDLKRIFDNATLTGNTSQKLTFKSAVFDMTMTNNATAKLEVDVYVLKHWGSSADTSLNTSAVNAAANTALPNVNGNSYFSEVNLGKRGVTLFDLPNFFRYAKVSVLKKIKYFIEPGDGVTYQVRDPKNRIISEKMITDGDLEPGLRNITQSICIVFKPTDLTLWNTAQLQVAITRKYSFTDGTNDDASGFVVS